MNKNTSNNFVNKLNNKKRISIKTKIALWYTSMIIIIVLCFLGTMFYISSIFFSRLEKGVIPLINISPYPSRFFLIS